MELLRVLTYVQRGQRQPNRGDHSNGLIQNSVSRELAAVLQEIVTNEQKVIEKFAGAVVVAPYPVWPPVVHALSGEAQTHTDDGELESNRLLSIDPQEAWIEIRKKAQIGFDRVAERGAGASNAFGTS